jgi:hypothetical protein
MLMKAKLKAAKIELKARTRQLNIATRAHGRCVKQISTLEARIEKHLARIK